MGYGSSITFGALTLNVDKLTAIKVSGTIKQVIGKRLIQREVPGRTVQDWRITIQGRHVSTNRATNRTTLESYDDLKVHKLTDGIHDGDYFVERLSYADDGSKPTSYSFTLVLIQDQ